MGPFSRSLCPPGNAGLPWGQVARCGLLAPAFLPPAGSEPALFSELLFLISYVGSLKSQQERGAKEMREVLLLFSVIVLADMRRQRERRLNADQAEKAPLRILPLLDAASVKRQEQWQSCPLQGPAVFLSGLHVEF